MLPLDFVHAFCLLGVALYMWQREPPRLLLVPLTLISFVVLYGIGNIIYGIGEDNLVPDVRSNVTVCLILMWIGLLIGIELSRATSPARSARSLQVIRSWQVTRLSDPSGGNQLLAGVGFVVALYMLGTFLYLGKQWQILGYMALQSAMEKAKFRANFGSEGGYLYQTLVASVAPFLSFVLLLKGLVSRQAHSIGIALMLSVAVLAGKIGTFEKTPWLVYLLQFVILFQATRSLKFGVARGMMVAIILLAGVSLALLIAVPDVNSPGLVEFLLYRILVVNNEVIYQTFYVYPHYLPHTWGMNIGLIHTLFGSGDFVGAHTRVASFFGADGATFDSFFIGDAWVDFSFGGVLVIAVMVGFVLKSVDIFMMSLGKTALSVALLGSSMYGLFQLEVTSAFTAFLSGGLLLIPMLASASAGLMNDFSAAHRESSGPAPWLK